MSRSTRYAQLLEEEIIELCSEDSDDSDDSDERLDSSDDRDDCTDASEDSLVADAEEAEGSDVAEDASGILLCEELLSDESRLLDGLLLIELGELFSDNPLNADDSDASDAELNDDELDDELMVGFLVGLNCVGFVGQGLCCVGLPTRPAPGLFKVFFQGTMAVTGAVGALSPLSLWAVTATLTSVPAGTPGRGISAWLSSTVTSASRAPVVLFVTRAV